MLLLPKLKRFEIYAAAVSFIYVLFFILWFVVHQNKEFSFYAAGIIILFFLFFFNLRKMDLSPLVLWGFVIVGFLHLFGGALYIFGIRLYDLMSLNLIDLGGEFVLIKYDQVVHFFASFFTFLGLSQIYNKYSDKKIKKSGFRSIYLIFLFAAFGIASANEIVEFIPAYFWIDNGVGGYVNTILDLYANFFGSFCGLIYMSLFNKSS